MTTSEEKWIETYKIFDRISAITSQPLNTLWIDDQWELCKCREELLCTKVVYASKVMEISQEIKDMEAMRTLELKGGETKLTEVQIKSIIQQEKGEKIKELASAEFSLGIVTAKADALFGYITCLRDSLRTIPVMTAE